MYSQVTSLVGWAFLPNLATRRLVPIFHKYIYHKLLHRTPPQPGTPLYAQHYRYTYAFAILSYLLYNLIHATWSMPPNYYEKLGILPDVEDSALKAAFRQFARTHHPDKTGIQGTGLFVDVRAGFEALKNPVTRFAYDRSVYAVIPAVLRR